MYGIAQGARRPLNIVTATAYQNINTATDVAVTINCLEVYCGGAGNLIVTVNGATITYAVQAGQRLAISPQIIKSAGNGTTATGIICSGY